MQFRLPRGIYVKLSVAAATLWLVAGLYNVLSKPVPDGVKLDMVAIVAIWAVVILGFGLLVQWSIGYYLARTRRRRWDD